jgi:hypothetical protein
MKQFVLTVAMGKRIIGKAIGLHPAVKNALHSGTLVIVAGTTNGCAAEEILNFIGQKGNFSRGRFFRGITLPANVKITGAGRLAGKNKFPGDVIINEGRLQEGQTINDIASKLKEGDVILKGGNALDLVNKRAAVLVGNPDGGTIAAALPVIIGRRVRLIIPIGLEKRISGDLDQLAAKVNSPGNSGYRLFPMPGEVFTEIEALRLLTGVQAEMISAGGVGGAEGGVWLNIDGSKEQLIDTEKIIQSTSSELPFMI